MNKYKIIEARNRTYDIYRRSARKISEFDSAVLKVEIHYKLNFNTGVSQTKPLVGNNVAIVNQSLFESFYLEIRNFQYRLESGLETLTSYEKCDYNRFLSYMIKGWMRPDILPAKITGKLSKEEWFSYFKSISYNNNLAGNYKVSAGLFKNFDYMEYYYTNSIKKLK